MLTHHCLFRILVNVKLFLTWVTESCNESLYKTQSLFEQVLLPVFYSPEWYFIHECSLMTFRPQVLLLLNVCLGFYSKECKQIF